MSQQEISIENNEINNVQKIKSNIEPTTQIKPSTMISVKDFAYDENDELHYGIINYSQYLIDEDSDCFEDEEHEDLDELSEEQRTKIIENKKNFKNSIINIPKNYYFEDGPPWKEDPDLKTPMIKDDSKNEFEFSISSSDEIHGKAIALFDFQPENDNEVALKEGQIIWISYRHGQGWLVAEDSQTGETGLVPEEYVQLVNDLEYFDEPKPFLPGIIQGENNDGIIEDNESDWIDEDDDELPNVGDINLDK
ncbi:Class E vacuolar protein-sorting machinery protein [Wickerhamomyces ciferrii]|uniref:Class E vacuolar protein-sorting machinery protein n=1 Tax=Wickerhamomyces ciferrii (strain ATCC 14091 / BCRC 22168 / CBS 111 / JCM 3599 / NBRC 0793 / NRRL Y-1031 F-60-10) TaxID=1206466 RepID=K0KJR0_WICCF|nr:Class E vacuolar protein-sorting machinery protein [Wickerhamomyces ciferrii]CCH41709.1 Class E vacuolar protein-sorting machinery protein [Wickerhamomyces ciferrii]